LSRYRIQESTGERRLRKFIPLGGVLLAIVSWVVARWVAPDNNAQGFQLNAEITKMCLTLAVAFISGAVVSFLIGEYGRMVEERHREEDESSERQKKEEDELNQQQKADASERRRLVSELRQVHHDVTAAKLRINAHKTVKSYGEEIRQVIIPMIAELGGVIMDVNRQSGHLFQAHEAKAIADQLGIAHSYLQALTDEYEKEYLTASLVQEADYKWRQNQVSLLVQVWDPTQWDPTEANLPKTAKTDSSAWRYLKSKKDNDEYRFAALVIFLELEEAKAINSLDKNEEVPYTHEARFSKPIRDAMNRIDSSQRRESERTNAETPSA
jgi:hypothetical protein